MLCYAYLAVRADKATHVFDHTQNGQADFAAEVDLLANIKKGNFLKKKKGRKEEKVRHAVLSAKNNGACAHYVTVSKFQWKPFRLAT